MHFRFTIGRKIGAGFSSIIIATLIVFILTTITLFNSKRINNEVMYLYTPSVAALSDLNLLVVRSKMLISKWVSIQSGEDNEDKQKLIKLINEEYPLQKKAVLTFSENWDRIEKKEINSILHDIGSLLQKHIYIMSQLNSFDTYEDPMILFLIQPMVKGGEVDIFTNKILNRLVKIIEIQKQNAKSASDNMISSFNLLQKVVIISGIILIIGGIIISFFTVKTIVTPIYAIKDILFLMAKGVLPKNTLSKRYDEIGEMSVALDKHIDGLNRTVEFSKQVGSGNFKAQHQPLSEDDNLGHTLIKMRNDLYELTNNLEEKVKQRTHQLQEANNKINDSINYAQRIQQSIIPLPENVRDIFPESFIFYKPRDVISGDFPWLYKKEDDIYIAAVDCTGHGVPGTLLSFIGYFLLNEIVSHRKVLTPAEVLDLLNIGVKSTLKQNEGGDIALDGMDIALCKINLKSKEVQFAGAYRPLYHLPANCKVITEQVGFNGAINQYKGDRHPIGGIHHKESFSFTNHSLTFKKGDSIFFFSDGLPDQFGGTNPNNNQYSHKRIQKIIVNNQDLSMHALEKKFENDFKQWKGNTMQYDDVLMIGIRF